MRLVIELWDKVHEVIIEEIEFSHKKKRNIQTSKKQDKERS